MPVVSMAHSMSWGRPASRSSRTASAASSRSSAAPGRSPRRRSTTLPLRVSVAVQPSTSPLTSRSGPPRHGRDDHPVGALGHRIDTEEHAAPRRHQERLHEHGHLDVVGVGRRGVAARPAPRATASTNASQPRTSSRETNTPAIELDSVSSLVADDRTTSAAAPVIGERLPRLARRGRCRRPASGRASSHRTRWSARSPGGRAGRPAERARAAAFAPTSATTSAAGSSRPTTVGLRVSPASGEERWGYVSMASTSSARWRYETTTARRPRDFRIARS